MYLKLENICKEFNHHTIFQNLTYEFASTGLYFISGKSGCGKTTLLNIIAGYENFESGHRYVDPNISIACIFQSYELIDQLTVKDNIFMSIDIHDEDSHVYDDIIKSLDLEPLLNHYPHELSGGEKQRIGIARAILCHPQMIICDEPTESLDIENKGIVLDLLQKLSKDCIVIVASHEKKLLENICDFYLEIKDHQLIQSISQNIIQQFIPISKSKINLKKVKDYIHKITFKRSLSMTFIFIILCTLQIILYQVELELFNKKPGNQALNSEIIYIDDYKNDSSLKNETMIPMFDPIYLSHQYYQCHIYPQPKYSHYDNIPQLKDNEIIINENVKDLMLKNGYNNIIGTYLKISYKIDNISYPIQFKIVYVIDEKDVRTTPQIYYSHDYLMTILQSKPYTLQYPTQYDYLIHSGIKTYAIHYPENEIEQRYEKLSSDNQMSIYHSILTPFKNSSKSQTIYRFIFKIIEITLFIFHIVYTLFSITKEIKSCQFGFSVLNTIGVPLKNIKNLYFIHKIKILIVLSFIPLIEIFMIFQFDMDYSISLIYLCFMSMLYTILVFIKLRQFHKQDIALVLKEKEE